MKRIFSLVLVTVLILSQSIQSYGALDESKSLERAITTVKTIVDIPENYSEFNYTTSMSTVNGKTYTYWSLSWNDNIKGLGIYASVDMEGNLINYSNYKSFDADRSGLAKISKEAAVALGEDFLNKALPDYGSRMEYYEFKNKEVYANEYILRYMLYQDNVPVAFAGATVFIDKFSGEINSYYYNGNIEDLKVSQYPNKEGIISSQIAGEAFLEGIGINPVFKSYYDYQNKNMRIFLAYEFGGFTKAIDAKTGEVIDLFHEELGIFRGPAGAGGEEASKVDSSIELTDEESEAIENSKNLMDKNEAEGIGRSLNKSFGTLNSIGLEPNYIEKDKFSWSLYFENGYVRLNAITGEIYNYSIYDEYSNKEATISIERARDIGEDFISKISNNKFEETRYKEQSHMQYVEDAQYASFNFVRVVKGFDFDANYLNVTINRVTGQVTSYSCEWYDSFEFPSVESIITPTKAFDIGAAIGSYGLVYKKAQDESVKLVYDFIDEAYFLIDAAKGIRISSDGEAYQETPKYTDIEGNWAEAMIIELIENGYYLRAGQEGIFNPKETTSQIEFLRYLYSPISDQYKDDEAFYNMLVSTRIIREGEINPNKQMSRGDTAVFLVRYLGYEKLAEKGDMFKNYFKDQPSLDKRGYAAVCFAFDIIKGDGEGKFNQDKLLNHSEAAKVIYKTISIK